MKTFKILGNYNETTEKFEYCALVRANTLQEAKSTCIAESELPLDVNKINGIEWVEDIQVPMLVGEVFI